MKTLFASLLKSNSFSLTLLAASIHLSAQSQPTLVMPPDDIVTADTSIIFVWDTVLGGIDYHFQIADNPFFSPFQYENQNTLANSDTVTFAQSKKYYWRVRANTAGCYTNWSAFWTFTRFSPLDANVTTWYKADFGIQTDINGMVVQWNDASGWGNHATQANAVQRPFFVANSPNINNKPLLRFDGVDDYVVFNITLTSINTVFWVIREDSNATPLFRHLLGNSVSTTDPDFVRGCCEDDFGNMVFPGTVKYIYDDDYTAIEVLNGITRVNGVVVNPLVTNMPVEFSVISTRTTGNTSANNFTQDRNIFEPSANAYRVWHGDLAELIIFNDPLSDSLINLVEKYLRAKYLPCCDFSVALQVKPVNCNGGSDGTAHAVVTGGTAPYTYTWSRGTPTTTPDSVTNLSTGTICVTVTDASCSVTVCDSITVCQPAANAGTDTIAYDLSLKLNPIPSCGIGAWQKISGPGTASFFPNSNSSDAVVNITNEGVYEFEWTETSGTCFSSDTVTVEFHVPVLPTIKSCLWLRADAGITTDLNGNVQSWADQSPSANNALQTIGPYRPALIPGIPELNGMPALRFDGVNDYVQFNMIDSIRTILWVIKEDSNATPFYRHLLGNTVSITGSDFTRGCCEDDDGNVQFPGTVKYIYDDMYAHTNVSLGSTRVNGVPVNPLETNMPTQYSIISTRTIGNTQADAFSIDRPYLVNEFRVWDGDLAELIIFCQPLSDSLIDVVEAYLRNKYAFAILGKSDVRRQLSEIKIFPNPTTGTITLQATSAKEQITIIVYDALGRQHLLQTFGPKEIQDGITVDLNAMTGNVFFLRMSMEKESAVMKVLKF